MSVAEITQDTEREALPQIESAQQDLPAETLEKIEEQRQFETLPFKDERDVVDAVLMGGPVALAVKRFGDDDWEDVRSEFLGSVAEYRQGDGSYAVPGEFVTVSGVRPLE